ncbi:MAG: methylmalonyl-CoA epimerase [Acidobacteriota bacterium]
MGIAVEDLAAAGRLYEALGLACTGREEVEEQKVTVAFYPLGETRLELLQSTDPEGPIGKFIARKGPGLHHLCVEVPNVAAALERLAAEGFQLIDRVPRTGAGGCRVAFVHPKSTGGVLLELSEKPRK